MYTLDNFLRMDMYMHSIIIQMKLSLCMYVIYILYYIHIYNYSIDSDSAE